jgi:hypothetical protein
MLKKSVSGVPHRSEAQHTEAHGSLFVHCGLAERHFEHPETLCHQRHIEDSIGVLYINQVLLQSASCLFSRYKNNELTDSSS